MRKNIIVCSDGTGNTAIKGRGTNVFKIFEAIDLSSHRYEPGLEPQVAIYDDGVGTESFKPLKLLGGVFGYGLSRNVRQLYKELARIYEPSDRIYLFGFSRGAFTVRTLAGMISACGILDTSELTDSSALDELVARAYSNYRLRYRTKLKRLIAGEPDLKVLDDFKQKYTHGDSQIELVGVWDTVDAVGLPFPVLARFLNATFYQFKFPNLDLGRTIQRAYHALAIDDERHSFHPLLWREPDEAELAGRVVEQVWFAGAHSNVGGGYPKQGMSLVALDWMMTHAEAAGLRFISDDRTYYRTHANADDKLYDPRAGLGSLFRWLPRDIDALCEGHCAPKVHLSALERAAHGTDDYGPGNLPTEPQVVFTPTGSASKDAVAEKRACNLAAEIKTDRVLLREAKTTIALGRSSYRICMVAPLIAAAATLRFGWAGALAALVTCFAVGLPMAYLSRRARRGRFSTFWLQKQRELRKALKSTRSDSGFREVTVKALRRQSENDPIPSPAKKSS